MKKIIVDVKMEMNLGEASDNEIISNLEKLKSLINQIKGEDITKVDILSEIVEE